MFPVLGLTQGKPVSLLPPLLSVLSFLTKWARDPQLSPFPDTPAPSLHSVEACEERNAISKTTLIPACLSLSQVNDNVTESASVCLSATHPTTTTTPHTTLAVLRSGSRKLFLTKAGSNEEVRRRGSGNNGRRCCQRDVVHTQLGESSLQPWLHVIHFSVFNESFQ